MGDARMHPRFVLMEEGEIFICVGQLPFGKSGNLSACSLRGIIAFCGSVGLNRLGIECLQSQKGREATFGSLRAPDLLH